MAAMSTSNPALRNNPFIQVHGGSDTMTINGVLGKSAVLWALLAAAGLYTWSNASSGTATPILFGGMIVAFVLSLVISFRPQTAPIAAPIFAVAEGLFLGGITALYAHAYNGIAGTAMLATVGVFLGMLVAYRTGIVRVTDRFRTVVTISMMGVFFTYLASFILSFMHVGIPGIFGSGPIGIAFSLVVIGIASLMLAVDFDMIERGVAAGSPKYMEWYGGFALMVTLVWIYLEMLRLLSKLRD